MNVGRDLTEYKVVNYPNYLGSFIRTMVNVKTNMLRPAMTKPTTIKFEKTKNTTKSKTVSN